MNRNIREAVERFQDNMITYIDINPAFHDHRFCEPNSTKGDQFNWNNNVWLWNSPARWWIEISRGDQKEFYDMLPDDPKRPDFEEYDKLLAHPDGDVQFIGQIFSQKYVDPDDPGHTMLIGGTLEDVKATGDSGLGGIVGRTLHPTFQGHESMGKTLVNVLAQRFKEGATEQPYDKENCPEDCTCFEIGISCPQTPP